MRHLSAEEKRLYLYSGNDASFALAKGTRAR
jgi:hypothetical protein